MKKMKKLFFGLILLIIILFTSSCEELFTTIAGMVSNDGIPVEEAIVLVLNANTSAYEKLSEINELSSSALSALTDIVKGFDISSDNNGNYLASMLSGGTVYVIAISDDGSGNLDSLDLIGWYGKDTTLMINDIIIINSDTIIVDSTMTDSLFSYTIPEAISIEKGRDTTGIDINNLVKYKWFE
ncbi:hypothetical protein KAX08_07815 [candidate division WOR-3 bacterium]|nr:hypothetical protein [candidate division WOR-3 bacterium]